MEWVKHQLEARGIGQGELAKAIGMTEVQMSKIMGGTRRVTAVEADAIRHFFGYSLPDDPQEPIDAKISECIAKLRDEQKLALAMYLEALAGSSKNSH
jgi:transcriptional regulator with XRE-family HTH domain